MVTYQNLLNGNQQKTTTSTTTGSQLKAPQTAYTPVTQVQTPKPATLGKTLTQPSTSSTQPTAPSFGTQQSNSQMFGSIYDQARQLGIDTNTLGHIQRKAESNIGMDVVTGEKQQIYDAFQNYYKNETLRKASEGLSLDTENDWKNSIYDGYLRDQITSTLPTAVDNDYWRFQMQSADPNSRQAQVLQQLASERTGGAFDPSKQLQVYAPTGEDINNAYWSMETKQGDNWMVDENYYYNQLEQNIMNRINKENANNPDFKPLTTEDFMLDSYHQYLGNRDEWWSEGAKYNDATGKYDLADGRSVYRKDAQGYGGLNMVKGSRLDLYEGLSAEEKKQLDAIVDAEEKKYRESGATADWTQRDAIQQQKLQEFWNNKYGGFIQQAYDTGAVNQGFDFLNTIEDPYLKAYLYRDMMGEDVFGTQNQIRQDALSKQAARDAQLNGTAPVAPQAPVVPATPAAPQARQKKDQYFDNVYLDYLNRLFPGG